MMKTKTSTFTKYLFLGFFGATVYMMLELIFRGWTHWSSCEMGALAFLYLGLQNENTDWDVPMWVQMLKGGIVITIIEFVTGVIVIKILHQPAWDYSDMPFNLWGIICLPFCLLWTLVLAPIGIILDDYLRYWFFGEEKPHYRWI